MFCPNCGEDNPDKSKFCFNCGQGLAVASTPIQPPPRPPTPVPPAYPVSYAPRPSKDRSIAIILEVLPGLFGFLGIGWIYSGNVTAGVLWLVGMLAWTAFATLVAIFSAGIALLCTLPISVILIIVSAVSLNNYSKRHTELFGE